MTNIILDGELYIHSLFKNGYGYTLNECDRELSGVECDRELSGVERYQFLSESCKISRIKPHDNETMVEYWIFDIWDNTGLQNIDRWGHNDLY